jgi:hypothetical protein
VDRDELAGTDPNDQEEDCQAQYDDCRAAGRHVPTKFDRADGGTGHSQSDDCERENHHPAMLCRWLVRRDAPGRAGRL